MNKTADAVNLYRCALSALALELPQEVHRSVSEVFEPLIAAYEAQQTSVLQPWVMALPLRAQGTLLTGFRGCDLAPKNPGAIDEK